MHQFDEQEFTSDLHALSMIKQVYLYLQGNNHTHPLLVGGCNYVMAIPGNTELYLLLPVNIKGVARTLISVFS